MSILIVRDDNVLLMVIIKSIKYASTLRGDKPLPFAPPSTKTIAEPSH
jgi:hypothetical protein